jgi:hypothetical protein
MLRRLRRLLFGPAAEPYDPTARSEVAYDDVYEDIRLSSCCDARRELVRHEDHIWAQCEECGHRKQFRLSPPSE